ncbi:MAG: hypothetical protein SNJ74_11570 [Fimbriimonadaceae bacterium]
MVGAQTPSVTLGPLDLAVVVLFVAAILALGFSARLRDSSVLQYLAAGRSLTLPAFVATLVSTWYGGILGIAESVSYFGVGTWILLGVPYYVFAIVYALWIAPRVRSADQISIPERIRHRFGVGPAFVGALLVFLLAVPAAHVLMLGTLISAFTGWEIPTAVVVAAGVGVALLYRGGLLADVRVSMLAFAMMYVGFGSIVLFCLTRYPPIATIGALENKALLTWDGGSGWPMVASFFILGAWTLVDPGFHQRVASARDALTGRRGVLVGAGCWVLFDLLSITTGLYALALMPPLPETASGIERLTIFPAFGEQILPAGLKAVFICGMLGTIASAMVGYTLVAGATFGREGIARLRPGMTDPQIRRWTQVGLGAAAAIAVAAALSIESVVALWYSWAGAMVGALILPFLMAYRRRPVAIGTGWITASMALSVAGALLWMAYGIRTGNPFLTVQVGDGEFSLGTLAPSLAASAAILAIGRTLAIIRDNHGGKRSPEPRTGNA